MTTTSSASPQDKVSSYLESVDRAGVPVLGHMVWYSVFDDPITLDELTNWFRELGLDSALLPNPVRPIDVAERVTGSRMRVTYSLDGERPLRPNGKRARKSRSAQDREATLMARHVTRDVRQVVRHLVREVRDERAVALSYDPKMAECVFERDHSEEAAPGAGTFSIKPNLAAINALPAEERPHVYKCIADMEASYRELLAFVSGDRLRELVRTYVTDVMHGVPLSPSGGVYFIGREYDETLSALYELVQRFKDRGQARLPEAKRFSTLRRMPLLDLDESRQMIEEEFTTSTRVELEKLSADIVAMRQVEEPDDEAIAALYGRFKELQAATTKHGELLSTSLDDTQATLETVNGQLASLLAI